MYFSYLINSSIFLNTFEFLQNLLTILKIPFRKFEFIFMKLLVQSLEKILSVMWNFVTKTYKIRKVSLIFEYYENKFHNRIKISKNYLLDNVFVYQFVNSFSPLLLCITNVLDIFNMVSSIWIIFYDFFLYCTVVKFVFKMSRNVNRKKNCIHSTQIIHRSNFNHVIKNENRVR